MGIPLGLKLGMVNFQKKIITATKQVAGLWCRLDLLFANNRPQRCSLLSRIHLQSNGATFVIVRNPPIRNLYFRGAAKKKQRFFWEISPKYGWVGLQIPKLLVTFTNHYFSA